MGHATTKKCAHQRCALAFNPLPAYVHAGERQDHTARGRLAECRCRTEDGKDHHVVQLGKKLLGVFRRRDHAVGFHPAIRINQSLDHDGLVIRNSQFHFAGCNAKLSGCEQHGGNVGGTRSRAHRNRHITDHDAEEKDGAHQAGSGRKHEVIHGDLPLQSPRFIPGDALGLLRNCNFQTQGEVSRGRFATERGDHALRTRECRALFGARRTRLRMTGDHLHLGAGQRSIQIRGKHGADLFALGLCCIHLTTSTACASGARSGTASFFSAPAEIPSSAPCSFTYCSNLFFSAWRPRIRRDFTVPSDAPVTSAISSYERSSMSRRITVVRYGSLICDSSASTLARTSSCMAHSNGDSEWSCKVSL